jgi:hypothetical protein
MNETALLGAIIGVERLVFPFLDPKEWRALGQLSIDKRLSVLLQKGKSSLEKQNTKEKNYTKKL